MHKPIFTLLSVLVVLATLAWTFVPATAFAAPPAQEPTCERVVTVQANDWLSKLADKYFGNAMAYPVIVEATNQKHAADSSFARIDNPDLIEPGWKLCIVSAEDAKAMLAKAGAAPTAAAYSPFKGVTNAPGETYYMVTFVSGDPYWKDAFRGMQDAAALLNVKVVYAGTESTDPVQESTVMEQVMAKNPAGITVTAVDPDGLKGTIDKAIAAGIPTVNFDADAPASARYSFLATGNYAAGVTAARALCKAIGGQGEVATSNVTGQLNQLQRQQGFEDTLAAECKGASLVARLDNKEDATIAAQTMAAALQAHPNIVGVFAANASGGAGVVRGIAEAGKQGKVKVVSFDFNPDTLDAIDKGDIHSTIGQGTWEMGFWSLFELYAVKHNLIKSVSDWHAANISPLPPYVDTGTVIIAKENSKFWRGLGQ